MNSLTETKRILWILMLTTPLGGLARCDELTVRLIDGVVSRATALHSAQIDYRYTSARIRKGSRSLQEQMDLRIAVDGTNWVLRYGDSSNFRMRRNNSSVNFYEVSSKDDPSTSRSLNIEAPETLQELIAQHACHAAPRLGTLWFPEQIEFVDHHRAEARVTGDRTVNGTSTVQIEWDVQGTDFDEAMIVIPNSIARARRGRLRLCVAPTLGYAIPLIEYLGPGGEVAQSFSASDFKKTEGRIFFPYRAECTTELDDGHHRGTYEVSRIASVNRSLPKAVFAMKIPQGTRVRDSRPGLPVSIFYLQNQSQFDDLNSALDPTLVAHRWSFRRILLIVNAVFLVTCLGIYVIRRCLHPSST